MEKTIIETNGLASQDSALISGVEEKAEYGSENEHSGSGNLAEIQHPTSGSSHAIRRRNNILLLVLVVVNVAVMIVSIVALSTRRSKGCVPLRKTVVAPLSVPCDRGENLVKTEEEEREVELCFPLDHHHLASAVATIFRTVLENETERIIQNPPRTWFSFDVEPTNSKETLLFTNHYKPLGYVTQSHRSEPDKSGRVQGYATMLRDWPLRVESYRSHASGYVKRMTWGLAVPASGVYRVHSSINFFFTYPMDRRRNKAIIEHETEVPVIHQISRYHARDGNLTVLTQRNHTTSSARADGLTSFMVTLAYLEIGDVICISVSSVSQLLLHDLWRTEGLSLVR